MRIHYFTAIVLALVSGACTHSGVLPLETVSDQGPVDLRIASKLGDRDVMKYFNSTITKNFSGKELIKKNQEDVAFQVETVTAAVAPDRNDVTYRVKTLAAEGGADLHDFGMPQVNEEFDLKLTAKADVLAAGGFDRGTIFYVPPVSLPKDPVQIGETWPMTAEWVSMKTGIPLKMEIVSILKSIRKCGDGRCAEIEVSGDVQIIGVPQNNLASRNGDQNLTSRFSSQISGRILFHIDRGAVVYQYSKSLERLSGEVDAVEVESCIMAAIDEPKQYRVTSGGTAKCNPSEAMPVM